MRESTEDLHVYSHQRRQVDHKPFHAIERLGERWALHETFVSKASSEWERVLQEADVPAAAVVELKEVFESPQFKSRRTFVDMGLHRYVAQPARFSTGSVTPTKGPPELGQHAEAILAELGYGPDETARLQQANAIQKIASPVPP